MLEDAINNISAIIHTFPDIKEISVKNRDHITIFLEVNETQVQTFTNSIDLLEWCEKNLKSTLDDVKPQSKIVSFFKSFRKKGKLD
jgi:hypothetical protein